MFIITQNKIHTNNNIHITRHHHVLARTVTANWHLHNDKIKFKKSTITGLYHTKSTIMKPVQKPAMFSVMT